MSTNYASKHCSELGLSNVADHDNAKTLPHDALGISYRRAENEAMQQMFDIRVPLQEVGLELCEDQICGRHVRINQ